MDVDEEEEPLREDVDVDLLTAGLRALSARTTTASMDEARGKAQLVRIVEGHKAPLVLAFDQLTQQLYGWRVMNFNDLAMDRKRDTIVALSNWIVSQVTLPEWRRSHIAPSGIAGAGYGLFAKRALRADDEVTRYGGVRYDSVAAYLASMELSSMEEATSEYIIASEHGIMDGETGFHLDEQGRWANTQRTPAECNAEFRWTEDKAEIWLCATQDIAEGAEIFVWYSEDYVRHLYGVVHDASVMHNKRPRLVESRLCFTCGDLPANRVCGQCEAVHYCSERCARVHWGDGQHKTVCEPVK